MVASGADAASGLESAFAFVEHYYQSFDAPGGRNNMGALYSEQSTMTWEGAPFRGAAEIGQKLASLPFTQCQHQISTCDCQASGVPGGIIVFVTGMLLLEGQEHPLKFAQVFHLVQNPQGGFFVLNDIFRLN